MIAALFTGIAATSWMRAALRYGAIAVAVLLFLLALRRSGERADRMAERLETTEKVNDKALWCGASVSVSPSTWKNAPLPKVH